jgi:hypothetical protein
MDRRDFLKRSIAASVLTALSIEVNGYDAILLPTKGKIEPNKSVKGLPTGRMVFGGNLFNGYARGRDSVDAGNSGLRRTQLSRGFLAGWQPVSDFGSQKFTWKGAY